MKLEKLRDRYSFYIDHTMNRIEEEKYKQGFKWKPGTNSENLKEFKMVYDLIVAEIKRMKMN